MSLTFSIFPIEPGLSLTTFVCNVRTREFFFTDEKKRPGTESYVVAHPERFVKPKRSLVQELCSAEASLHRASHWSRVLLWPGGRWGAFIPEAPSRAPGALACGPGGRGVPR